MSTLDIAATPPGQRNTFGGWLPALLGIGVAVCLVLIFGPFTRETIGGAAIVLMLILVFARVPIGFALLLPAVAGLYSLYGGTAALNVLQRLPYDSVATWEFSVIPMFVFMGLLLWRSGLTEQLYAAARPTVGRLPGGLAVATNIVGIGLAAVSGATIGVVHALARIGVPEMLRAGYHKSLAVGAVVVAGLPGQIIPPSVFLIIYAGIAEVPVGPQLIAGVVPGLLLGALFCVTVIGLATFRPGLVSREEATATAAGPAPAAVSGSVVLGAVVPIVVLAVVVIGGMFTGIFTATEAGAAGAFGALLLTVVRSAPEGSSRWGAITGASTGTLASVGQIFLLILGAQALARLIAVSGIGTGFARWMGDLDVSRVVFLLILLVAYLIMGAFMDPLSIMLLTVPLLLPVLPTMEISPLWFGVFVVVLAEMAIVTPPIGVLAFIVHDIVSEPDVNLGVDISLGDVFRAILMFAPAVLGICLLLIGVPDLATWLPDRMDP